MNSLAALAARLRSFDPEAALGLRPPYPPVALEMERDTAILVRLRPRRRALPQLESHVIRPLAAECVPTSIFHPVTGKVEDLAPPLLELFESSGTKPGRISLVLPDNLAKITLLGLPERPSSRRVLDELVRAKMRRAVPFRIEDACLSYQVFSGTGSRINVLVVLVRRALVERFERAFEAIGARVGLIDICTPNLINLCRGKIGQVERAAGDVALLNSSQHYFSLVIFRDEQVIFFRCKTFAPGDSGPSGANGVLVREMANSFSYYREKLGGQGVSTVFVRSTTDSPTETAEKLRQLGCTAVHPVDPADAVDLGPGQLDERLRQRIAPAVGAAAGRGR